MFLLERGQSHLYASFPQPLLPWLRLASLVFISVQGNHGYRHTPAGESGAVLRDGTGRG